MAPMIANAIDPLRSISRMAEMVDDAQAAIVLTQGGSPLRLPGMPSHPVLDPGAGVLNVACDRLVTERSSGSFLAPYAPRGAPATYLLVTVLACAPRPPYHPIGVVLVSPPGDLYGLSRRELEVLGLVVEGWPNHRIAAAMALSQRTVNTHLERILAKLGVPTRTVAAVHALRFGLYLPRPLNGVPTDLRPG
jgi:DNA-binding CsgD family transcriptional regulator